MRILMADDVVKYHRIYEAAIVEAADEQAHVVFVASGEEAIATLQGPDHFDLCILDFDMPGKTGGDVLTYIRSEPKFDVMPVVFLTGSPNPKLQEELLERGADDFIAKGAAPEVFSARIKGQLRHRKSLEQLVRRTLDLDIFAAGVVHDLRNLEMGVLSVVEIAAIQLENGNLTEVGTDLDLLATRLDQIRAYAQGIIAFARNPQRKPQRKPLQISALIDWARDMVVGQEKTVTLQITVSKPMPDVLADEHLLKLVFLNILQNSVKYSGSNEAKVLIELAATTSDSMTIRVRDFGSGVSKSELRSIFQPFYRCAATLNRPGIGLGLALVAKAIADMDGRIWAEHPPEGTGTLFYITLPKGDSPA